MIPNILTFRYARIPKKLTGRMRPQVSANCAGSDTRPDAGGQSHEMKNL
ncbi:hypothetical protein [Burkholderia sp. Ac-20344]|nr:hypothetical protein [Burkholderia sp. Ac-20344]MBN3833922.1 hypothetical protein [Burkholderia sp. Ac-20344]